MSVFCFTKSCIYDSLHRCRPKESIDGDRTPQFCCCSFCTFCFLLPVSGLKVPSHVVKRLLFALLIVPLFFCFFVLDPKTQLAGSLFSLLLICITLWKEWLWMQRCHPVLLETKCWQFHQVGLLKLFKGVEEHMINSTLPQDKGRFNIFITSRDKEKPESPVGF